MTRLQDVKLKDQRVLMRVDFNVPLDENLCVADATRISAALPTIKYILAEGGKLILMTHLGRPKGQVKEELRLEPVARKLSELLGQQVEYVNDCIGAEVEDAVRELASGQALLLENLRFYPEEEKNDPEFCKKLASLGDVYINDGFAVSHRAHASVYGVPEIMQVKAPGFLLEKEIENLTKILNQPAQPLVALIGGAKISTKIKLVQNLLTKVDYLLLGGALANTLLLAQGFKVGKSLVELDYVENVKNIKSAKLKLPVDVIVASEAKENATSKVKKLAEIEAEDIILDLGPETIKQYAEIINQAKTLVWNGPMGMFEVQQFAKGTNEIAQAVITSKAYSVVGGGETIEAVNRTGMAEEISFISTGGGAMLEFLEGKDLPGIAILK